MKDSKKWRLNLKDVLTGLVHAVIGSVIASVCSSVTSGGSVDIKQVAITSGVVGLTYLGTQLPKGKTDEKVN